MQTIGIADIMADYILTHKEEYNKAEEINNRINEIINEEVRKQLKYYLGEDQLEVLRENEKLKEENELLRLKLDKIKELLTKLKSNLFS